MKFFLILFLTILSTLNLNAQKNSILIIADDLGTDYFGFYENHKDTAAFPNLRKLLGKGVRFTNAWSNPVCSPTRAGILTGRYSFRTGIGDAVGAVGSITLDTTEKVLPRLLKHYNPLINTANIGKWHLNLTTPASNLYIPNLIGYDEYSGNFLGTITSYTNWVKYTNGTTTTTVTNYATTETTNDAIKWIRTKNTSPFFVWLAYNAPHTPIHLPPSGLHSYSFLSGTSLDINTNPKPYFKASLEALDHEIGRLFDSLIYFNKMDSTNIIFIGDNGNGVRTAQIANTSRAKGTVYDYGVHVPFIISGPCVINPGRVSSELVNTTDLFATILELFGYSNWITEIPIARPVDSKSILPILKNVSSAIRPWAFTEIFKTITDSADGKSIRNKNYQLIRFNYGKEEFYNFTNDSTENNDLLITSMTSTDVSNYYYLCNEMANLIGSGAFCTTGVNIPESALIYNKITVNPNPFSSYIKVSTFTENETFELINIFGQIIYKGNSIETQNFSYLPSGIYFLKKINKLENAIKLIKE